MDYDMLRGYQLSKWCVPDNCDDLWKAEMNEGDSDLVLHFQGILAFRFSAMFQLSFENASFFTRPNKKMRSSVS